MPSEIWNTLQRKRPRDCNEIKVCPKGKKKSRIIKLTSKAPQLGGEGDICNSARIIQKQFFDKRGKSFV